MATGCPRVFVDEGRAVMEGFATSGVEATDPVWGSGCGP